MRGGPITAWAYKRRAYNRDFAVSKYGYLSGYLVDFLRFFFFLAFENEMRRMSWVSEVFFPVSQAPKKRLQY